MTVFSIFVKSNFIVDLPGNAFFAMITGSSSIGLHTFAVLPDQATLTLYHQSFVSEHATNATNNIFFFPYLKK